MTVPGVWGVLVMTAVDSASARFDHIFYKLLPLHHVTIHSLPLPSPSHTLTLTLTQLGVTGLKCTDCMQGFYFFNTDGCVACDCSGLTNDCSQNTSVTSEPSEVCSCPQPYVGDTCDRCDAGFFLSAQSGSCEPCSCNGLADVCLDGDGTCVVRGRSLLLWFCLLLWQLSIL